MWVLFKFKLKCVVAHYIQNNIHKMPLYYDPNEAALTALSLLGTQHSAQCSCLASRMTTFKTLIASIQANANAWFQNNVRNYGDVRFKYVAIGNEVQPGDSFAQFLVSAMRNIQTAISNADLGNQVQVSIAIDTKAIGFVSSLERLVHIQNRPLCNPIIRFLVDNKSPLLVNLYPYFAYLQCKDNIGAIHLDYALFIVPSVVVQEYKMASLVFVINPFDAILDVVYSALENAGGGVLEVVVSETGGRMAGGTATTVGK